MTPEERARAGRALVAADAAGDTAAATKLAEFLRGQSAPVVAPQGAEEAPPIPEPVVPELTTPAPDSGLYRDASGQTHYKPDLSSVPKPFGVPFLDQYVGPQSVFYGGGQLLKGVRDATVGAATLIPDLFGADSVSNSIQQNIPRVDLPPESDIGSTFVQYGLPGAGGFKAAQGVAKSADAIPAIARSPLARNIIQWLSGIAGAGAGDAVATDASQAQTIGNFTGGPTEIQPGDSNLEKRLKVGAEGAAIPAVTDPIVKGVKGAVRGAKTFAKGVFNPVTMSTGKPVPKEMLAAHGIPEAQNYEAAVASDLLRKSTDDIPAAVRSIDKTKARFAHDPSFKPMTGETTNDPGLLGMQRSFSSDRELLAHDRGNIASVDRLRQKVTQPGPEAVRGDKAQAFFEGDINAKRQAADSGVSVAEKNLADENAYRRSVESGIENKIPQREDAAEAIDSNIKGRLDALTETKNAKFDTIDPNGSVGVDIEPLYRAANEATSSNGILDSGVKSRIRKYAGGTLNRIERAYQHQIDEAKKAKEIIADGGQIPFPNKFRDLQQIRSELSGAIKKAREDGAGDVVERLAKVKKVFEDYPDKLAQVPNDAGKRAKDAVGYFKDEFAPNARQGAGGKFQADRRTSAPGAMAPTETPKRFVKQDAAGGREAAMDLNRLVGQNNPDVRRYAVADMAKYSTRADGKVATDKLDSWVRNRREFLDANPDIRREINQMRNRITTSGERVGKLEEELNAAIAGKKMTEAEINKSAANLFVGEDPVVAIDRIMKKTSKHVAIRELVGLAKKDSSGDALKGLRTAFGEWLEKPITNTGKDIDKELLTSAAKLENMFKDRDTANALNALYEGTDNIKVLNEVRERLSIMARRNQMVTRGSDTHVNKKQAGDTNASVLTTLYHLSSGKGIITSQMLVARGVRLTRWLSSKILNLGPDESKEIVTSILKRSMTDPDLARVLLMHDSKATQKIVQRKLTPYITNNLLASKQDNQK